MHRLAEVDTWARAYLWLSMTRPGAVLPTRTWTNWDNIHIMHSNPGLEAASSLVSWWTSPDLVHTSHIGFMCIPQTTYARVLTVMLTESLILWWLPNERAKALSVRSTTGQEQLSLLTSGHTYRCWVDNKRERRETSYKCRARITWNSLLAVVYHMASCWEITSNATWLSQSYHGTLDFSIA